ncbi:LacI family transcriptional regulator [Sinomonas cellulolyticus]|uniref:LacI family DNA-binding transcriptional regulator n=1 Tax=Sinomonas cellulolyticus TaxID=2801916 RepID=A0ABS1JXB4_9MICC|nr:LacI family DNA-binding transcriptional regulator [Sinomonas cellulolyticus]GHG59091.1 LacI family transcriptional regulator [Sinomonas sp. KCTC 49339]
MSVGAVSRALSADKTLSIREETRERILGAAKMLNYSPNHAARSLRMSSTGLIGLAVHDVSNPLYSDIVAGAQTAAIEAGYVLTLTDADVLATDEEVFRRLVASKAIDGILLQTVDNSADSIIAKTAKTLPVVMVNAESPNPEVGSVTVDDHQAALLATNHLLELGHRKVAYLTIDEHEDRAARRLGGWRDAMIDAGLVPQARWIVNGGHSSEGGMRAMEAIISTPEMPTAVVAANSLIALGAMKACQAAGLQVPDQVSIVGIHDFPTAAYLNPGLTVVSLPLRQLGERAVQLLLDQREGKRPVHEKLSAPAAEVIARGSTGPCPGSTHLR